MKTSLYLTAKSPCCKVESAIVRPTAGFGAKKHPASYRACSKCAKEF